MSRNRRKGRSRKTHRKRRGGNNFSRIQQITRQKGNIWNSSMLNGTQEMNRQIEELIFPGVPCICSKCRKPLLMDDLECPHCGQKRPTVGTWSNCKREYSLKGGRRKTRKKRKSRKKRGGTMPLQPLPWGTPLPTIEQIRKTINDIIREVNDCCDPDENVKSREDLKEQTEHLKKLQEELGKKLGKKGAKDARFQADMKVMADQFKHLFADGAETQAPRRPTAPDSQVQHLLREQIRLRAEIRTLQQEVGAIARDALRARQRRRRLRGSLGEEGVVHAELRPENVRVIDQPTGRAVPLISAPTGEGAGGGNDTPVIHMSMPVRRGSFEQLRARANRRGFHSVPSRGPRPPLHSGFLRGRDAATLRQLHEELDDAEALEHILGGRPPTRQLSANAMLRARRRAAAMPKMAAPGGPSGAGAAAIAADRSRGRLDEYATTSALNPFLVMTKAKAKAKAKPKAAAERNDADNRTHGGRRRYSRRRRRRKQKSRKRRR